MSVDVWVFGYGSLIFRADFPFEERRIARIFGFARRFWQSSPDHRGTPEAPGRVVTLIESPNAALVGVAYRIESARADAVLAELDHRERAGYERVEVRLEFVAPPFGHACGLTYLARPENSGFVESASELDIASVIRGASGPSGDNVSYVRRLAQALREIGEQDPHVFAIERLLAEAP
jgi:cation transport protein ChaC